MLLGLPNFKPKSFEAVCYAVNWYEAGMDLAAALAFALAPEMMPLSPSTRCWGKWRHRTALRRRCRCWDAEPFMMGFSCRGGSRGQTETLSQLRTAAPERFCQRVLAEIESLRHQQQLGALISAMWKCTKSLPRRDKEIAQIFNDHRPARPHCRLRRNPIPRPADTRRIPALQPEGTRSAIVGAEQQ